MADNLREELSKLLDQYDQRREAVRVREQKVKDDDALFVARFAELRRNVIRPAFEVAAALLAERGHTASITEHEFAVAEGSKVSEASISLRVATLGTKEENARALSVSTRHYNKTVLINAGKPLEGAKGTHPLDQVDRQRIEEELLRFVGEIVAG